MEINIINNENQVVEQKTLNDEVFGAKIHNRAMHTCVVGHLASLRRGTHATKTRSMVKGSGKKPWKQKGTGNARAGAVTSPLWRGGGVTFGPMPRDYSFKINKKVGKTAMKSALSLKARDGNIIVLDKIEMEQPKTGEFVNLLKKIDTKRKALIVIEEENKNVVLSARNITGVRVQRIESLNTYDVLAHNTLVLTRASLEKLEERLR